MLLISSNIELVKLNNSRSIQLVQRVQIRVNRVCVPAIFRLFCWVCERKVFTNSKCFQIAFDFWWQKKLLNWLHIVARVVLYDIGRRHLHKLPAADVVSLHLDRNR
jgi:hypothetical protein